jgi:hypothetical protein
MPIMICFTRLNLYHDQADSQSGANGWSREQIQRLLGRRLAVSVVSVFVPAWNLP